MQVAVVGKSHTAMQAAPVNARGIVEKVLALFFLNLLGNLRSLLDETFVPGSRFAQEGFLLGQLASAGLERSLLL